MYLCWKCVRNYLVVASCYRTSCCTVQLALLITWPPALDSSPRSFWSFQQQSMSLVHNCNFPQLKQSYGRPYHCPRIWSFLGEKTTSYFVVTTLFITLGAESSWIDMHSTLFYHSCVLGVSDMASPLTESPDYKSNRRRKRTEDILQAAKCTRSGEVLPPNLYSNAHTEPSIPVGNTFFKNLICLLDLVGSHACSMCTKP